MALVKTAIGQNDSLKQVIHSNPDQSALFQATDLLVKGLAFKEPDSALFYGFKIFESVLKKDTSLASSLSLNLGTSYYAKGDYDNALIYWQKAADLSSLTAERKIEPLALNNVAIIYQNTGRIEDAIGNFARAIKIYKERGDTIRVGRGTFNIGKAHIALGNDSIGVHHIKRSIEIYSSLGRKALKNLANAYNELASVFYYDSEYASALENYHNSLRFYLEAGDTLGSLKPRGNIGNIHRALGNSEEALATYKEIIETKEKFNQFNVHFNYHNLGEVHVDMGNYDQALINYRKALGLRKKAGLLGLTNSTLIGMAESFKALKQLDSANQYYTMIYSNSRELDEAEYIASSVCAYCDWLFFQGKQQEALPYVMECYREASAINARKLEINASNWLQEIYALNGDFKKAYQYLQIANQLSDSLFNADLIREIAVKEAAFENEKELIKRENSIKLLESKKQVADLRIKLLLIGVILIAVTAFFISRMLIVKRERKKKELEAINRFRGEMTGMIAHDLKSPLSVIMNANDSAGTKQMAAQMLQLINNMLDVHRFESTEVNIQKSLCSLQEIINSAKAQVQFLMDEKDVSLVIEATDDYLIAADKNIMLRVLVNLLTNAIKYSPFNENVRISVVRNNEWVQISISDKGQGIDKENMDIIFQSFGQLNPKDSGGIGSTGLGLTFVKLALEAHGSGIEVDSKPDSGTTFSFKIPLVGTHQVDQEDSEVMSFEFSEKLKKMLRGKLAMLRKLNLHQVGDIEKELKSFRGHNKETDEWVDQLLNSVYAGNKEKYEMLLDELE